ncbi:terminase small subunit [Mucilaginibacter galii]
MPIGTPIIMKHKYILFSKVEQISHRIADYFKWIEGEYHTQLLPFKPTAKSPPEMREQKVWDREPQPPTLSGLAFHLGFDSLQAFEAYEKNGRFAAIAQRARLKIESEYEKMLHHQPATGAIFALKSLGWMEKQTVKSPEFTPAESTLKIEIIPTGPAPASCEQDVKV